jgi:hypothetical protein
VAVANRRPTRERTVAPSPATGWTPRGHAASIYPVAGRASPACVGPAWVPPAGAPTLLAKPLWWAASDGASLGRRYRSGPSSPPSPLFRACPVADGRTRAARS